MVNRKRDVRRSRFGNCAIVANFYHNDPDLSTENPIDTRTLSTNRLRARRGLGLLRAIAMNCARCMGVDRKRVLLTVERIAACERCQGHDRVIAAIPVLVH
jgi:hypothetical protein